VSYRATVTLKAFKRKTGDVIETRSAMIGGVDANKTNAARTALINSAKKAGDALPQAVLKYLKERSVLQLAVVNVSSINVLNDLIRSIRALPEIRDAKVRSYDSGNAVLDMDVKRGTAQDVAKRLEQLASFGVGVKSVSTYRIDAELGKK
jgi:hypothetical protein